MKVHNLLVFLLVCFTISCDQYPIFYTITTETEPKDPLIEGSPTNMVVVKYPGESESDPVSILYVASGKLHWYAKEDSDGNPGWNSGKYKIPQPQGAGRIVSLAAAPGRLYALRQHNSNALGATLQYMEQASIGQDDAQWRIITNAAADYPLLLIIYTDPETKRLFAGARKNDNIGTTYAILYLDDNDNLQILKEGTGLLSGAACRKGIYYLSTIGDGIFQVSETSLTEDAITVSPLTNNNDETANNKLKFMSMITLDDPDSTIIAVVRDGGSLYRVNDGFFQQMNYDSGENDWITTGKYATGALAVWENDLGDKLLVAGIQGALYTSSSSSSSYTHGYVEFKLKSDGSFDTATGRMEPNISVNGNTDRYTATIGKRPISHLFQASTDIDPNRTFFASTQTKGLWSYRDRSDNGGWQWNAEE